MLGAGLGAVQPAVGLTALQRLLVPRPAPAAVVLSPLLLPAFLSPPARGSSSLYEDLGALQSPAAQPSHRAPAPALPQQQLQQAHAAGLPQAEEVLSVLADIVRGVLGQPVAADQPLMEVCPHNSLVPLAAC